MENLVMVRCSSETVAYAGCDRSVFYVRTGNLDGLGRRMRDAWLEWLKEKYQVVGTASPQEIIDEAKKDGLRFGNGFTVLPEHIQEKYGFAIVRNPFTAVIEADFDNGAE